MYKLIFYIPAQNKEEVKNALFAIGVGKFNNYDKCSFETLGTGQFRPINNAKPFLGQVDTVELVQEYKIEMICEDSLIKKAVEVLKQSHPYEEVAYEVFKMGEF
jgi:hypothetical protein